MCEQIEENKNWNMFVRIHTSHLDHRPSKYLHFSFFLPVRPLLLPALACQCCEGHIIMEVELWDASYMCGSWLGHNKSHG